ncbi:hypothetical protein C8J27_103194 [Rhodobacter aestuarii]|uniref:Uncharacterized protein n=1 Tax=Rhodobacter aestuarii TaxID=453582 RepID=A0A1N7K488_9RHOB|nr:hypothetical protein [Rhodobacter aestuarii]PTV95865.1 hypothetical protein C8J27_103194 [Rhodobacter aestuarii]SIS56367.1 hypothetical protein SAMN05421580_102240 [Rhodobacter aestuarii]
MITLDQLRTADPRDIAEPLAYTVSALIRTARLALENETSGEDARHEAATVLGLAEELSHALGNSAEGLQRETKRGAWAVQPEAAA